MRHSTANAYKSYLNNRIKPRWGSYTLSKVKPFAVEQWLRGLDLAPRTKGHLHNLMRVLWNCAMRWELTEIGENPMKLVRVRGTSKRRHEPIVLGVPQCHRLLAALDDPFRTLVILDLATGLRCLDSGRTQCSSLQTQMHLPVVLARQHHCRLMPLRICLRTRNRSNDGTGKACVVAAVRKEPSSSNPAHIACAGEWISMVKKHE